MGFKTFIVMQTVTHTYLLTYIFIPKVCTNYYILLHSPDSFTINNGVPTFCYKNSSKYYGIAVKNDKKRGSKRAAR